MIQLVIAHKDAYYEPSIIDNMTVTWERKGAPGILKFTCYKDKVLKIAYGDPVSLVVDDVKFFFGYVFNLKYGHNNDIEVTAYDQLRYFKNKDSYIYKGKRADQLLTTIATDFGLKCGKLANTKYKIPKKSEDNKTLFDIIQNALDDTLTNTGNMFVLYDKFGELKLTNITNMKTNVLINETTAQSIDYQRSIDGETYNKIKLAYDNKDTGKREVYIQKDSKNINKWGVLQYYEKISDTSGAITKAKSLLNLYNTDTRSLRVNRAFGDLSIRAGSSVIVQLNYLDLKLNNFMIVEKVVHRFEQDFHVMDLTLQGGVINDA